MTKPEFVYVTYIRTTPEKAWRALVDPDMARQYWKGVDGPARVNVSDWKPGSAWEHRRADETEQVDIVGTVVESDPPRRLVITWARPKDKQDPDKHSRVTFAIESKGVKLVCLTVTHEDFKDDAQMLAGVSSGWPLVLSNLKTFLETGTAV